MNDILIYEYATTGDSVRAEELLQALVLYYILMYESEKEMFSEENEIDLSSLDDSALVNDYALYLRGVFIGMRERTRVAREKLFTLERVALIVALHKFVEWNFERIDTTESNNATQTAQLQVAWIAKEQNDALTIYKRWVTRGDSKVCPICKALAKQDVIPLDEPFLVNGQIIEQPDGEEVIYGYMNRYVAVAHPNCRCHVEFTLVY